MDTSEITNKWLTDLNLTHPLLIAGPCSAETETQLMNIAHELKDSDVNYFRAGVWKPRTRPGNFEGIGALALEWLKNVKNETGLKTCTEVANANHVELALKHDVDLLWIGARSTVSPFIVQDIANALQGTDKIVLVKNPVNPDLSLWMGGIERLLKMGVTKLGAIHRGFSTYEKTLYRNNPEWQIIIDLKNELPNLPIICDPSHISGKREMIQEISQTALDLNFDGLMIETHDNPDKAWSDAKQQITPKKLVELYTNLKVRNSEDKTENYRNKIEGLRTQIDLLDDQLINTLSKRMDVVDKIGLLKKEHNVSVLQNERWLEILNDKINKGHSKNLDTEFIKKLFKDIHEASISYQEKIVNP